MSETPSPFCLLTASLLAFGCPVQMHFWQLSSTWYQKLENIRTEVLRQSICLYPSKHPATEGTLSNVHIQWLLSVLLNLSFSPCMQKNRLSSPPSLLNSYGCVPSSANGYFLGQKRLKSTFLKLEMMAEWPQHGYRAEFVARRNTPNSYSEFPHSSKFIAILSTIMQIRRLAS